MKERKISIRIFVIMLVIIILPFIFPKVGNINLMSYRYGATGTYKIDTGKEADYTLDLKNKTATFDKYKGNATTYKIPSVYKGLLEGKSCDYKITAISSGAFDHSRNSNLRNLIVPDTVTKLEPGCFSNLKYLERLYLFCENFSFNKYEIKDYMEKNRLEIYYKKGSKNGYDFYKNNNMSADGGGEIPAGYTANSIYSEMINHPINYLSSWSGEKPHGSFPQLILTMDSEGGRYNFYYEYNNQNAITAKLIKYSGNAKEYSVRSKVTYPAKAMQVKVTSIGENAFSGNSNLQTIKIPDTVKQLDANCFYKVSSLKKIYLKGKTFNWTSPNQFSWYGSNITVYCHLGSHGERFAKVNGAKVANINSSNNTINIVKDNNSNNNLGIVKGANNSKKTTNNNTKNNNTTVQKNTKTSPGSTQTANNGKNSVEKNNNTKKSTTNKNTTAAPKDTSPPIINSSITSDKKKATLRWSATDNVGITGYKIVKQPNAGSSGGYTTIKSTKSLSNIDYKFYENGIWYLYVKDARRKFFLYNNNS